MLKSQNDSQLFITKRDLSCVWIAVSETPGAPLVCIWTDEKMRAFEEHETSSVEATIESGSADEGPESRSPALTVSDVKHSV